MKQFVRKSMLAFASVVFVTHVSQAASANNDLILGFTQAGGANDYVINLGQATTGVGVGGSAVVDLSSFFDSSTYSSTFTGPGVVSASVVGGKNGAVNQVYLTTTRSGGAGTASVPGSTGRTDFNSTQTSTAASQDNGTTLGVVSSSDPNSFTANVLGNYSTAMSYDPSSAVPALEDLWLYTSANLSSPTYEGYFTINPGTSTVTFTPEGLAAVPEPSTYGLLACAGLLVISLRRQFLNKLV